ncbi:MAG: DUF4249 family protein [Bacteroidales bacterium]|nr:DUF4249 family protein [Bacteroidales bacterium]
MKKLLILCIPIILLSSSCRKLVQDEFDNFDKKITVNSILIQDEFAQLHLSLTDELNPSELTNINNAVIEMFNQDSVIISFAYVGNGIYNSDYIVKENDYFTLNVLTDNDFVNAKCEIPERPEIFNFYVNENGWVNNEGILQPKVNFTIPNNTSQEQYFEAYIVIYNETADNVNEEYPILYFDNTSFCTEVISKSIKIEHHSFSYPPEKHQYQLIIKSVDKNYYYYVKSLEDYNLSRYPDFSNSSIVPLNLFSNIENGYGIFCGYSHASSDIIQPIY